MLSSPQPVSFSALPPPASATPAILRAPPVPARRQESARAAVTTVVSAGEDAGALQAALESLAWCEDVIVWGSAPSPEMRDVIAGFPHLRWQTAETAAERDQALVAARHDWILTIEPDEVVSGELADEIRRLRPELHVAYAIRLHDYLGSRHIRTCGWSRERPVRLFHRNVTGFAAGSGVRSGHLRVQRLRHPIRRQRARSLDELLVSMHLEARQFTRSQAGAVVSPVTTAWRSGWTFLRSYLLRHGWRQGADGLTLSVAAAQAVFWKHAFAREAARPPADRSR